MFSITFSLHREGGMTRMSVAHSCLLLELNIQEEIKKSVSFSGFFAMNMNDE